MYQVCITARALTHSAISQSFPQVGKQARKKEPDFKKALWVDYKVKAKQHLIFMLWYFVQVSFALSAEITDKRYPQKPLSLNSLWLFECTY